MIAQEKISITISPWRRLANQQRRRARHHSSSPNDTHMTDCYRRGDIPCSCAKNLRHPRPTLRKRQRKNNQSLSSTQQRGVVEDALEGKISAAQFAVERNFRVVKRRVQQISSGPSYVKCEKVMTELRIKLDLRKGHLTWCRRFVSNGDESWFQTFFLD